MVHTNEFVRDIEHVYKSIKDWIIFLKAHKYGLNVNSQ